MTSDILDRLAVYAPTATSVGAEWGPHEREQRLGAVLDGDVDVDGRTGSRRLRFVPAPAALRTRAVAPIAASVAVLVLAGGVAVLAGRGHGSGQAGTPAGNHASGPASPSPSRTFHATVDTPRLGAHQWVYRAQTSHDPSHASTSSDQQYAVWIAADGSGQRLSADGAVTCERTHPVRDASINDPTQDVVDKLPTDPDALKAYLTKRVQGSTSREEAIFTAVGDLLRDGDLLASSDQRAALVTVLAGLQRTSVHDDTDARGRSAIRIDFVDPNQRGDAIQSLYFDARTFQLLEERDSTSSAAVPSNEPSAPYTSEPSERVSSPLQLTDQGSVAVLSAERVVDTLPANCGIPK